MIVSASDSGFLARQAAKYRGRSLDGEQLGGLFEILDYMAPAGVPVPVRRVLVYMVRNAEQAPFSFCLFTTSG